MNENDGAVRIDKWLWAARFFKTRSLAKAAIDGGKVHFLSGETQHQRVKPNKAIHIGDKLSIRQGYQSKEIIVDDISEKRGGAKDAALLYHETEESLLKRQKEADIRKASANAITYDKSKPSKKDRRKLNEFQDKNF